MPGAGAGDLEVSDCALGVDGGEGEVTGFGGCIGKTVERGGFARGGFADEGDERVAWHCVPVGGSMSRGVGWWFGSN